MHVLRTQRIAEVAPPGGVDTRLTESFLLGQPEIVDATVFWSGDQLTAHITISDTADWTPRKIKAAVCEELGLHQTPREVICQLRRMRVA